jgi:hypothetical protein
MMLSVTFAVHVVLNERIVMNNELERMWKEAVTAHFMVLY